MEGLLWGDYSLVSPLTQASSVLLVRDMDTESGRDTKSEKALAKSTKGNIKGVYQVEEYYTRLQHESI